MSGRIMDDQTLIKAFLKKQKDIQDEFITRLENYKAPVDTTELKKLVEDYKTAVYGAASLKPKLDTSQVEREIKEAITATINTAIRRSEFEELTKSVSAQARAVEKNNSLLSNGTGWQLKYWVILLTLIFGFMAGWGVNWYFEIPAKIAGSYQNEQLIRTYKDGLLEGDTFAKFVNSSCKLKQDFGKFNHQGIIDCSENWNSPKRLLQK